MSRKLNRRQMLRRASLAGVGLSLPSVVSTAATRSPNERLNIACVGLGNQGNANLGKVSGENIVALCDVDEQRTGMFAERFPKARCFHDFRSMLDKMDREIDAVVITTPNHSHATIGTTAMRHGKHVYCEKPLTHTVQETREMVKLAAESGVVTQMGIQIHASDNYRRTVELIESGAIGPVHDVHTWWWGRPNGWRRYELQVDRPTDKPPVPKGLDWDLWIGPAPMRPYHPCYAPHDWHYWWDFGNGEMGNMACHYMDLVFWALQLGYPTTIEAEGPPAHPESTPLWIDCHWQFPARGERPPVRVHWYHGRTCPKPVQDLKVPNWSAGVLFVGQDGMLLADYTRRVLLPADRFAGFQPPEPTIPPSIGHRKEWIEACKTGRPAKCPFSYSGLVTETVLLGNIAYRMGKPLQWDPVAMRFTNHPEADAHLHTSYRDGWAL